MSFKMNMKKTGIKAAVIVFLLLITSCSKTSALYFKNNNKANTTEKKTFLEREKITQDFITMIQSDKELENLMIKSISIAKTTNPDKKTNPVQTLDDYYDFLDWSAKCLPWNILVADNSKSLYSKIDQSLDYFYFLLDQPLPELAGKGLYYPCLEFYEPVASWVKEYCKDWGAFLSTEESWNQNYYELICREEDFGMSKGWYESPDNWKSFNDWFSRHLKNPEQRPVSIADIVSPADSTPQGIWTIDDNSQLEVGVQLKSVRFYNVEDIIGSDSKYSKSFAGGVLTHTFLDVNDYHRYHFPLDGKVLEVRKISALDAVGGLISWNETENKYVLWDNNPGWQSIETRDCLILETKYGLVAILPIGMSQVSSCNWEDYVVPGVNVKAGDPMGYFLFGGSDIVMIFQKNVNLTLSSTNHLLQGETFGTITIK